jgi:hypothetical protein
MEWHFDGAACKNKYIIFSLQQLLLKWWASKPHKFTLRMAASTFLQIIRENHVHYAIWNPQDDHNLNNLTTKHFLQVRVSLCWMNHHTMNKQWQVAAQPHTL